MRFDPRIKFIKKIPFEEIKADFIWKSFLITGMKTTKSYASRKI